MLDVHPPHHPVHAWRDFFVHIATIVVGLLIAVGIEQTVELIHRHHEMAEAREHIRDEVRLNQRVCREDQQHMKEVMARLNQDLDLANAAGTSNQDPNATLDFTWTLQNFFDAAYNSAKASGVLSRMPSEETDSYGDMYTGVTMTTDAMVDLIKQIYAAKQVLHGRRLADLPSDQLAALRSSLSSAVAKAEYYQLVVDLESEEFDAVLANHYRTDVNGAGK
jgi:hypothetical protein